MSDAQRRDLRKTVAIVLAVVAYAALALVPVWIGAWAEHLGPFIGLYLVAWLAAVLGSRSGLDVRHVLIGAVAFRLGLLFLAPSLSGDVYRYVWEGRVQNAGFDPYLSPPDTPALVPLRDAVWDKVNHRDATAIYPPLAQLAFRALAAIGGVAIFKAGFILLDLAIVGLLARELARRRLPAARLVLYAWNPLAVIEVAGSGHMEPLAILPLVAAVLFVVRHRVRGWMAVAASIGAKYAALAALPAFLRVAPPRRWASLAAIGVLALGALPFVAAGRHLFDSLHVYAETWRYNDLLYSFLFSVIHSERVARRVVWVASLLLCLVVAGGKAPLERRVLAAFVAVLALSPTVHPWYLLWPLVFVPLAPSAAIVVWSGTIVLSYLFLYPAFGLGPLPKESWTLKILEMAPVAVAAVWPWRIFRIGGLGGGRNSASPGDPSASAPASARLERGES